MDHDVCDVYLLGLTTSNSVLPSHRSRSNSKSVDRIFRLSTDKNIVVRHPSCTMRVARRQKKRTICPMMTVLCHTPHLAGLLDKGRSRRPEHHRGLPLARQVSLSQLRPSTSIFRPSRRARRVIGRPLIRLPLALPSSIDIIQAILVEST